MAVGKLSTLESDFPKGVTSDFCIHEYEKSHGQRSLAGTVHRVAKLETPQGQERICNLDCHFGGTPLVQIHPFLTQCFLSSWISALR